MLAERLLALTALAGRMVVVAAATDEWETARSGFAQLLGRGDPEQIRLEEQRLEETREQLAGAADPDAGLIRTTLARQWAGRLANLLDKNPAAEADLQALVYEMQAVPRAVTPTASNRAVFANGAGRTDSAGEPALEHPGALAARSELAYSIGQAGDAAAARDRFDALVLVDDREVAAAIAAEDPAGIAMAYDKYAAALYGYCHWMLREPAGAAEALRDTFVAAALSDLPEALGLRPWLYSMARNECRRRLPTTPLGHGEDADATLQFPVIPEPIYTILPPTDITLQFRVVYPPPDAADRRSTAKGGSGQPDLATPIRAVLAELKPDEREAIELSLRHDLYGTELATALGVSWNQAHALTSRVRKQLENDLGPLLIVQTGPTKCPVLRTLVAESGQLTDQIRDRVREHTEQCGLCTSHLRGALRSAAISGLQPLAILPPELRRDVLRHCSAATPDAPVHRRTASLPATIGAMRWLHIRRHPGLAIATVAVALWVVAAVSVTVLTLIGSH